MTLLEALHDPVTRWYDEHDSLATPTPTRKAYECAVAWFEHAGREVEYFLICRQHRGPNGMALWAWYDERVARAEAEVERWAAQLRAEGEDV